jgi:subtilisin family serine protease
MRAGLAALLALGLAAGAARGQVPRNVSARLTRAWARPDTTVLVWIIAERDADLDSLAARVRAAGGVVRHQSRFVWAVSAQVPGAALPALARERGVRRVQAVGTYFRKPEPRNPGAGPRLPGPAPRAALLDTTYGPGGWAQRQLNIPAVQALGDSGAGVRVAVLDAGVDTLHPYMAGARIIAYRDYVNLADPNGVLHGTATWSLLAAHQPGRVIGAVPAALFILAKTEYTPTETRVEEDHWVAAVEMAESLSVDIISSSLGYLSFDNGFSYTPQQLNGDVAVTTLAADSAAARGTLVVVAIGNEGPSAATLGTPADAKGIVAVGATDSLGNVASFSSRGPTADGRIKPEVVGPGQLVIVGVPPTSIAQLSGTSFATPLVAGVAALVQGTRLGQPASALRRGLLDAASFRDAPDNVHGWGIPDALKLLAFPTGFEPAGATDSNLAAITPTFAWDAGTPPPGVAPDTFHLQVGLDTALATIILDTTVTAAAVTLPRALPPGTRLFWRATARSALGVAESIRRVGPLIVPPWVTLLTLNAPSGGSIADSQPLFAWHAPGVSSPPGPITFDFSVFPASEGPAQPVVSVRGLTDTVYRPAAPLEKNLPFRWRIVAHVGADSAVVTSSGTFLVLDQAAPGTTVLFQNFPNPFPNRALGVTTSCIWFDIATPGNVRLEIFDVRGRLVRRIVPSAQLPAQLDVGRYGRPAGDSPGTCDERFAWDGRDETGAYARPGVYLYRLTAPGYQNTKRIVFLGAP